MSAQVDWRRILKSQGNRIHALPLDVILKNNVALSYFLDFLSSIGEQAYLFFLLNAEGDLFAHLLFSMRSLQL